MGGVSKVEEFQDYDLLDQGSFGRGFFKGILGRGFSGEKGGEEFGQLVGAI